MKRITPIETIRRRFASADLSEAATSETPLDPCLPEDGNDEPAIPPRIAALIAQREAARASAFRPIPMPGQIVRVPPRADDAGNLYNEYLAVLLDAEIALGKWRGWMVGRDSDYASEWDLILGPEEEPRDPMCQLVQIWNPVSLTIQEADQVLAELTDERLAAVRTLGRDYARDVIPNPIDDHRAGVHVARELSNGTGVVTGTPLLERNDLRHIYQYLFKELAIKLSEAVQLHAPKSTDARSNDLFEKLLELTAAIAKALFVSDVPEQRISFSIAHPDSQTGKAHLIADSESGESNSGSVLPVDFDDSDDGTDILPVAFELTEYCKGNLPQLPDTYIDQLYERVLCGLDDLTANFSDCSDQKRNAVRDTVCITATMFKEALFAAANEFGQNNNYLRAEAGFRRMLSMLDLVNAGLGDSAYVGVGILDLIRVYTTVGWHDKAASLRRSTVETLTQRFRAEAPSTNDLNGLVARICACAKGFATQSCLVEAESLYKLASDIVSNRQTINPLLDLQTQEELADFYFEHGREADALDIFRHILSVSVGAHNQLEALLKVTKSYQTQENWEAALRLMCAAFVLLPNNKKSIEQLIVNAVLSEASRMIDNDQYEDGLRLMITFLEIAKDSLHAISIKHVMSAAYRICADQGRIRDAEMIHSLISSI